MSKNDPLSTHETENDFYHNKLSWFSELSENDRFVFVKLSISLFVQQGQRPG